MATSLRSCVYQCLVRAQERSESLTLHCGAHELLWLECSLQRVWFISRLGPFPPPASVSPTRAQIPAPHHLPPQACGLKYMIAMAGPYHHQFQSTITQQHLHLHHSHLPSAKSQQQASPIAYRMERLCCHPSSPHRSLTIITTTTTTSIHPSRQFGATSLRPLISPRLRRSNLTPSATIPHGSLLPSHPLTTWSYPQASRRFPLPHPPPPTIKPQQQQSRHFHPISLPPQPPRSKRLPSPLLPLSVQPHTYRWPAVLCQSPFQSDSLKS
jgi:hypothetical protein